MQSILLKTPRAMQRESMNSLPLPMLTMLNPLAGYVEKETERGEGRRGREKIGRHDRRLLILGVRFYNLDFEAKTLAFSVHPSYRWVATWKNRKLTVFVSPLEPLCRCSN